MADKMYTKDGVPVNWNGKFWHTYYEMLKMAIQDMDEDGEHWNVALGRIDKSYMSTDEGRAKLVRLQRKLRKTIMMSLSPELAELYRTETTGSAMLGALKRRFENRSSTVAVFHSVQRLEEELRKARYDVSSDIDDHLRKMRNKALELADLGQDVSWTTMMMYVLQSLPSKIEEFALIQTQNWCGNAPARDIDA